MTSIHAPILPSLRQAVKEAKLRGEDAEMRPGNAEADIRPSSTRAISSSSSVIMKKAINSSAIQIGTGNAPVHSDDEENEIHDPFKENDPSLSPSPVNPPALLSPRKGALGKRPLSNLPTPMAPEDDEDGITASERNISANVTPSSSSKEYIEDIEPPLRKSPKLTEIGGKGVNASGRIRENTSNELKSACEMEDEKENMDKDKSHIRTPDMSVSSPSASKVEALSAKPAPVRPTVRKTSTASSSASGKSAKARIGIRRL